MDNQPIQNKIYEIRGRRVMLDFDLAALYQVETKRLKEAVRRNIARFEGEDFMFEVTPDEYNSLMDSLRSQFAPSGKMLADVSNYLSLSLRSQIASLNKGRGSNLKYMPFAFTETGVAMLSSVLRSETAILVNRSIMRAFVEMRSYITYTSTFTAELAEIRAKLALLERNGELIARDGQETLEALNDLSEDIRKDIDSLYLAIGELSAKPPRIDPPRRPIGYPRSGEQ